MARSIDSNSVPKAVLEAFEKRFPGIQPEKWEMEAEYEAEFTNNGKEW